MHPGTLVCAALFRRRPMNEQLNDRGALHLSAPGKRDALSPWTGSPFATLAWNPALRCGGQLLQIRVNPSRFRLVSEPISAI
jgi:hypothetical protein